MTPASLSTLLPRALYEGRRIGLFGGSFNPPHAGHRAVAEEALKRLALDEVWWLAAARNPLKSPGETSDLDERMEQTRAMAAHPRFRVLDLERRTGAYYTADLLAALAPALETGLFVWIMGADSFATLHRWGRWREIMEALPVAVFGRPGWGLRALNGPAARAFRSARLPASQAAILAEMEPPAWVFLNMPLRAESSTRLRAARGQ